MFIPYGTDAPIYHRPWGTVVLVAINVLVTVFAARDAVLASDLVLLVGGGLSPLQWITSNFVHEDVFHLVGNMVFLWVFGQIVEGKVGWKRYVPIYLLLGAAQCAIEQLLGLVAGLEYSSYGASAIIFGLIAITLVWAPMNDIHIFYWISIRAGTVSLSARLVACIYLALEILGAVRGASADQPVTSAALHLLGAALGFPLGVLFVKRKWVDCEGWDLFSIKDGRPRPGAIPEDRAMTTSELKSLERARRESDQADAAALIESYLAEGDVPAALETLRASGSEEWPLELEEPLHRKLLLAARDAKLVSEARELAREYQRRFPEQVAELRRILAARGPKG